MEYPTDGISITSLTYRDQIFTLQRHTQTLTLNVSSDTLSRVQLSEVKGHTLKM